MAGCFAWPESAKLETCCWYVDGQAEEARCDSPKKETIIQLETPNALDKSKVKKHAENTQGANWQDWRCEKPEFGFFHKVQPEVPADAPRSPCDVSMACSPRGPLDIEHGTFAAIHSFSPPISITVPASDDEVEMHPRNSDSSDGTGNAASSSRPSPSSISGVSTLRWPRFLQRQPTTRWSPEVIRQKLSQAQVAGVSQQWYVRGPPVLLASFVLSVSLVATLLVRLPCRDAPWLCKRQFHEFVYWSSSTGMILGLPLLFVALIPTDHVMLRAVTAFCVIGMLGATWFFLQIGVEQAVRSKDSWAVVSGIINCLVAVVFAIFAFRLWWARRAMATRALLACSWRLVAETLLVTGIMYCIKCILQFTRKNDEATTEETKHLINIAVVGFEALVLGCLFLLRPDLPRHWQAALGALGGEKVAAAGIASVVGGRDAESVIATAEARCRTVPLDKVTKDDFACNLPVQSGLHLNQFTEFAELGDIDCFVSHSWHDNPEAKWEALQRWRQDFKEKSDGREPSVWLDKYCIDQSNITADLLCLPVFLAGSKELLILQGPSYLDRLWCIMEILIFLYMGGLPERITLRNLGQSQTSLRSTLSSFSVCNATCTKAEDKDMLLAIVEAGFGGARRFNRTVVELLRKVEQRDGFAQNIQPSG